MRCIKQINRFSGFSSMGIVSGRFRPHFVREFYSLKLMRNEEIK